MHAKSLTLSQRRGMLVLRRAGYCAALACLRKPGAAHTMVVAVRATAAQRCGVGIARAAPHVASALTVLLHASAADTCVLVRVVMTTKALTTP